MGLVNNIWNAQCAISNNRDKEGLETTSQKVNQCTLSHFSILLILFEILKLQIEGREMEIFSRREERLMQIYHKEEEAASLKNEGKWLMSSSIGSGLLAIFSGVCPIVGHMKGEVIVQKLGSIFKSLRDMQPERFFKSVTKMTQAMSEMYKSTGQIQSTFSQGHRTTHQLQSELNRDYVSERNQSMQELEDRRKEHERFCHEILQMLHETARQIHNR